MADKIGAGWGRSKEHRGFRICATTVHGTGRRDRMAPTDNLTGDAVEDIRELYAYNRWANRRILGAAAALEPEEFGKNMGSSFPSVRDTLVHILAAEWVWLARWKGSSPTGLPSWDLVTYDDVLQRWDEVETEQRAFVEALTDADRRRVVAYGDTSGRAWESRLDHMLRHVVNHSSYHRGQVITMLRQLGAETVSTDMIRYYREGGVAG